MKERILTKRMKSSITFKRLLLLICIILLSISLGDGIVRIDGNYLAWKAIIYNFAPAGIFLILTIFLTFLERENISISSIFKKPDLSFQQSVLFVLAGLVVGILLFPIIQLGFSRTMLTIFSLTLFGTAMVLLLFFDALYGVFLFILSLPILMKFGYDFFDFMYLCPFFGPVAGSFLNTPFMLLLIFFLIWLIQNWGGEKKTFVISPVLIAFLLYGLASLISVLFSHDVLSSSRFLLWDIIVPIMFFCIVLDTIDSIKSIKLILGAVIVAVGLWAFFGLFTSIRDTFHGFLTIAETRGLYYVEMSEALLGGDISELGRLMTFAIPLSVGFFLYEKKGYSKILWGFIIAYLFFSLFLSFSLDHWLISLIGLTLFVYHKTFRNYLISILIILFIFNLCYPSTGNNLKSELFSLIGISNLNQLLERGVVVNRIYQGEASLAMFSDHPFTGVGLGMFRDFYHLYGSPLIGGALPSHAHNIYLNVVAESGLLGISSLSIILIMIIRKGFYALKLARDKEYSPLILGCLVGIIVYLLSGITDGKTLLGSLFILPAVAFLSVVACILNVEKISGNIKQVKVHSK